MNHGLIICILAGSNTVSANVLPATIVRSLAPVIKSCTALVACKNDGFKISPQETLKALDGEEKRLHQEQLEWAKRVRSLTLTLDAAQKEMNGVAEQLRWIQTAQARVQGQIKDAQSKSPYEGNDLATVLAKEQGLINHIDFLKEKIASFSNPGANSSFWNPARCAEARAQNEKVLRQSYDKLAALQEYKKTLKD